LNPIQHDFSIKGHHGIQSAHLFAFSNCFFRIAEFPDQFEVSNSGQAMGGKPSSNRACQWPTFPNSETNHASQLSPLYRRVFDDFMMALPGSWQDLWKLWKDKNPS